MLVLGANGVFGTVDWVVCCGSRACAGEAGMPVLVGLLPGKV